MSLVLFPNPRLLPFAEDIFWRSGAEHRPKQWPPSHDTCFSMFIGITGDQCDVLVSLSPNLKRFFSRTFLMDARSSGLKRPRDVSDPIIIFAHPVSMIPFPGLSIASYSPLTQLRSILCLVAFSSNEQRCSRRLRILSSMEQCLLSKRTGNAARTRRSSRRSQRPSRPSWKIFIFTQGTFLVHLLCRFVPVSVDIPLPSAQQYQRLHFVFQLQLLHFRVAGAHVVVFPEKFVVVFVSTPMPAPLGPRLPIRQIHFHRPRSGISPHRPSHRYCLLRHVPSPLPFLAAFLTQTLRGIFD